MSGTNASAAPTVWTKDQLAEQAQVALEEFVDRRLAEPGGRYQEHVKVRRKAIVRLFKVLAGVDPHAPDPAPVRQVLLDGDLLDALRYVAGPPVSEDDLGVLVKRKIGGIKKAEIRASDTLPVDVLELVCRLADPFRFPWVATGRAPTLRELRVAIQTTSTLHATQAIQTERRGYGKALEQRLQARLIQLGFVKVSATTTKEPSRQKKPQREQTAFTAQPAFPPGGRVTEPRHYPTYPHFYGECHVYRRKVDLFIALRTGRMIALEAKDSSSGLNSTKRLLNDTAAKAKHYAREAGQTIIAVALLSGVFKLSDLKAAQDDGLYLVWAHDMDGFIDWIRSQT